MFEPNLTTLLTDPDLGAESFTVIRTRLTPADGLLQRYESTHTASGILQPDAPGVTTLRAGDDTDAPRIRIHTAFPLTAGLLPYAADEILYGGQRWKVTEVTDWQSRGFLRACATLMKEADRV